jgi:uncharacterized protein YbjT (DUF2867 family)
MNISVIITGSTGMIGKGVLLECLDDPRIERVLIVNRNPVGINHSKLKEIFLEDFIDPAPIQDQLEGYQAVFFCLGISAIAMKESDYSRITYDYTINFARTFLQKNPEGTFIYVSGTSTDSSEQGRIMWARVKGKTENELLRMPFKQAFMFRPGIIRSRRGIRSRTALYNTAYVILKPFWPLLIALFGNSITDTTKIGQAMIRLALEGSDKKYFENRDINALSG